MMAVTAPGFGSASSTNTGIVRLTLSQPQFRKRTQQEIADELTAIGKKYNFARTFVIQEQTIGGSTQFRASCSICDPGPEF